MSDEYEDFKRGDVVYMHVGPMSQESPRYIGVVTSGVNFAVKVKWFDRTSNVWIYNIMSNEPRMLRHLGTLPEGVEWDV